MRVAKAEQVCREEGVFGEEESAVDQGEEQRLSEVAGRIVMDEEAKDRVLGGMEARTKSRKRLALRLPAAVLAACLLLFILWIGTPGLAGDELVVYAATEENGWQKLKEGERVLLKMEPFDAGGEEGDFYEDGYPRYYPYRCIFRLEVPENCLYDRDFTTLGDDSIAERGGRIEWWVAPERPGSTGETRRGSLSLWLVSDNIVKKRRERIRGYELELTKEDGKCYAELKRVWEKQGE